MANAHTSSRHSDRVSTDCYEFKFSDIIRSVNDVLGIFMI